MKVRKIQKNVVNINGFVVCNKGQRHVPNSLYGATDGDTNKEVYLTLYTFTCLNITFFLFACFKSLFHREFSSRGA